MYKTRRTKSITNALQGYDKDLYAIMDWPTIRIYRRAKEIRREMLDVNTPVYVSYRNDWLVMSLTDTWGVNGKPVEWGIEPVMARIKALDLWNSQNVATEFWEQEEDHAKSNENDFKNNVESFCYDFRRQFAKATDGINTSLLSKKTDRRYLGDKKWQS